MRTLKLTRAVPVLRATLGSVVEPCLSSGWLNSAVGQAAGRGDARLSSEGSRDYGRVGLERYMSKDDILTAIWMWQLWPEQQRTKYCWRERSSLDFCISQDLSVPQAAFIVGLPSLFIRPMPHGSMKSPEMALGLERARNVFYIICTVQVDWAKQTISSTKTMTDARF